MKKLKLEETIVNMVLNPNKKFRLEHWSLNSDTFDDEYIYWCDKYKRFRGNGNIDEDINDYCTERDGWGEYISPNK